MVYPTTDTRAPFTRHARRTLGLTALVVAAGLVLPCAMGGSEAQASAVAAPAVKLPEAKLRAVPAFTAYYGIYVGGQKVGWMRSTYADKPLPTLSYHLQGEVRGMGRSTPIEISESRVFDAKTRRLKSVDFSQKADGGEVTVRGRAQGKSFAIEVNAGGAVHRQALAVQETLDDALAAYALVGARGGPAPRVGDSHASDHFDAASQKMSRSEMRIEAIEERALAGVPSRVFTLSTHYPQMGVKETSTLDGTGQMLQTQMGGFFEARLEPKEVAQKKELVQDVLMQAVVTTPEPIAQPESLAAIDLTLDGFEDAPPPSSARQNVSRTAKGWLLRMRRDAPLVGVPYAFGAKGAVAEPAEVKEARVPTAFIQSTAPEIVAAAKKAVGNSHDTADAVQRLVGFVRGHLRPEYVPAFSNALEALHTGRGDCTEHSVLFVALARAAHIPARTVVGVAYWPPGKGFGWHAWAEIWADGRWVSVDPTWGQAVSDATHLKLAEGGPQEQARVVMLLGRLKVLEIAYPD